MLSMRDRVFDLVGLKQNTKVMFTEVGIGEHVVLCLLHFILLTLLAFAFLLAPVRDI